jgi:hypothetical protein
MKHVRTFDNDGLKVEDYVKLANTSKYNTITKIYHIMKKK